MKLIQQLHSILESSIKDKIEELIIKAIDLVNVKDMPYEQACIAIANKVKELDEHNIISVNKSLIDMIKNMYEKEEHEKTFNEDEDPDSVFPKRIASAGDFTVEINENEKITLFENDKEIVSMPLVIWKQLTR